jgi:hypothetical protein
MSPEKGTFPSLNPLPTQAPPWNLSVDSYWSHIPSLWLASIRQPLPFCSYISSLFPCLVISALEDGDSMFLRNVGIEQRINMAPKPKINKNKPLRVYKTAFICCFIQAWNVMSQYELKLSNNVFCLELWTGERRKLVFSSAFRHTEVLPESSPRPLLSIHFSRCITDVRF